MNTTLKKYLILCTLLSAAVALQGQSTLGFSGGFGSPELFNVGLRIYSNQTNGELIAGFAGGGNTFGISMSQHLAGTSPYTHVMPFYIRAALFSTHFRMRQYLIWGNEENYSFQSLHLRAGYTLSMGPTAGIELDLGPAMYFFKEWSGVSFGYGIRFFFMGRQKSEVVPEKVH